MARSLGTRVAFAGDYVVFLVKVGGCGGVILCCMLTKPLPPPSFLYNILGLLSLIILASVKSVSPPLVALLNLSGELYAIFYLPSILRFLYVSK
jgi:hypothetical protein